MKPTDNAICGMASESPGRHAREPSGGGKTFVLDLDLRSYFDTGRHHIVRAKFIRRFIDPPAVFAFVDKPADSDVPFDMYSGGFGHRGGLCTFEVLCEEFGIAAVPVTQIAHIVHDLDLKENKYAAPESAAIGRMIDGLRALHADDAALLEQGIGMFEALARSFEAK